MSFWRWSFRNLSTGYDALGGLLLDSVLGAGGRERDISSFCPFPNIVLVQLWNFHLNNISPGGCGRCQEWGVLSGAVILGCLHWGVWPQNWALWGGPAHVFTITPTRKLVERNSSFQILKTRKQGENQDHRSRWWPHLEPGFLSPVRLDHALSLDNDHANCTQGIAY